MNGCKYIRERIDEADKPDLLPFDVSEHIGQCLECERFAGERITLRELLAGGNRVSAPINFDAMLKARLAEVKDRRSFWYLGSPAFLRMGAATAGLVVMVFAAQYAGLFSNDDPGTTQSVAREAASSPTPGAADFKPPMTVNPPLPPIAVAVHASHGSERVSRGRRGYVYVERAVPAGYMTAEDGGVVLVRGNNGDLDVQMPTVSVGAQPLLYVSAGQRTARTVGTSF